MAALLLGAAHAAVGVGIECGRGQLVCGCGAGYTCISGLELRAEPAHERGRCVLSSLGEGTAGSSNGCLM
jgi:hypothetical protein